jgi:tetratricopeptide (TPR) repeat protein
MDELLQRFGTNFSVPEASRFGARKGDAVRAYLDSVKRILVKLPMLINEGGIQEWLERLDQIERDRRFSEVAIIENWLDVCFGREVADRQRPLDLRLHRRLGELYAHGGQAADAVRQFELARQLAPRDIFMLRRLGKAYLDQKELDNAGAVLAEIEGLDPTAFERNAENAALKARWFGESGNKLGARDVLTVAYRNNSSSYYLGDLLGQALIELGEIAKAREVYEQVRRTLSDVREQNIWTHATAISAAIVCGDEKGAEQEIKRLRELRPSRGDLESIERGLSRLLNRLGGDARVINELHTMELEA